ncbi:MAG: GyrI-like domain-containing protein, partial [Ruminiclostridium sp.]|nr:GyrI-like domain-containing protein [Ruminiclostridium sp.]
LYEIKPDARYFGFNHPNPGILEEGIHGYEVWVTIPDDMEVPEPLVKKKFPGGLYAVMTIRFPEFQRWADLSRWVENNGVYEPDYSPLGEEIMGGCLEEHLNWVYACHLGWPEDGLTGQLDLMFPIKKRG